VTDTSLVPVIVVVGVLAIQFTVQKNLIARYDYHRRPDPDRGRARPRRARCRHTWWDGSKMDHAWAVNLAGEDLNLSATA
jgi:hypothetical protein